MSPYANFGINHVAPAPAAENAVVAGAGYRQVPFFLVRYANTQIVCGHGLALAGYVVQFTFDGEQRGALDG